MAQPVINSFSCFPVESRSYVFDEQNLSQTREWRTQKIHHCTPDTSICLDTQLKPHPWTWHHSCRVAHSLLSFFTVRKASFKDNVGMHKSLSFHLLPPDVRQLPHTKERGWSTWPHRQVLVDLHVTAFCLVLASSWSSMPPAHRGHYGP